MPYKSLRILYFKAYLKGLEQERQGWSERIIYFSKKFNSFGKHFTRIEERSIPAQQGPKLGYNPHKPGRASHNPIIAFVSDVKMVANLWLKSGNTG